MAEVGINIKKIMDKKGVKVTDVVLFLDNIGVKAKRTGEPFKESTLYAFFNGRRPIDVSLISPLSDFLKVPEQDFFNSKKNEDIVKRELLKNINKYKDKYFPNSYPPENKIPYFSSFKNEDFKKIKNKEFKEMSSIAIDGENYTNDMYAIKITSTEMYPQIEKNDTCLCVYDGDQPIKENMIVHYSFKEKNGIRVIKIDEETNQISLVPLNLEKHKIITIPSKELHLLKTAKIVRLIRDL